MADQFNPYTKWFSIPVDLQPPNHYVMLGVKPFESDPNLIDEAAERRATFLQDVANGPHTRHSQELLNRVAAARVCLMDPVRKSAYDQQLRDEEQAAAERSDSSVKKRPWARRAGGKSESKARKKRSATAASGVDADNNPSDDSMMEPEAHPETSTTKPASSGQPKPGSDFAINVGGSASRSESFPSVSSKSATSARGGSVVGLPAGVKLSGDPDTKGKTPAKDTRSEQAAPKQKTMLLVGLIGAGVLGLIVIAGVVMSMGGSDVTVSKGDRNGAETIPAGKTLAESQEKKSARDQRSNLLTSPLDSESGNAAGSRTQNNTTNAKPPANWRPDDSGVSRSGLVLWLDAGDEDSVEMKNYKVSRWRDKSENGLDAVQGKQQHQPRFFVQQTIKRPIVSFEPKFKTFLQINHKPALNLSSGYTIASMGWGNDGVMISKGLAHNDKPNSFSLLESLSDMRITKDKKKNISFGESAKDSSEFRCRILVADGQTCTWHVGDLAPVSRKSTHKIENDQAMLIGKRNAKTSWEYSNLKLAELLIYNRPLDATELKSLQGHLKRKWLADTLK